MKWNDKRLETIKNVAVIAGVLYALRGAIKWFMPIIWAWLTSTVGVPIWAIIAMVFIFIWVVRKIYRENDVKQGSDSFEYEKHLIEAKWIYSRKSNHLYVTGFYCPCSFQLLVDCSFSDQPSKLLCERCGNKIAVSSVNHLKSLTHRIICFNNEL